MTLSDGATPRGIVLLAGAAFLFALATVFLKFATSAPYSVSPAAAIFARFFVGFLMFGSSAALTGASLRPNRAVKVALRAVLNTAAVTLFFFSIKYTTVTKSNILNLTYPAFIFLIAPFMTGERQRRRDYLFLAATLAGAFLTVRAGGPADLAVVNRGDALALASGVVSAFAIAGLRETCKYDRPQVILFYQMGFGSLATFFLLAPSFALPRGNGLLLILLAAVVSNAGQLLLTEGYRHINAALGSIVLESGILFAAVLGIGIFHDPLTPSLVLGGLLIFVSIVGVSGVFAWARR
jgi:drug/metabolite transporter (DMT)-like permease